MNYGKLNPLGKLNFPGFQEILDFTATGSESFVSVTVDGDTDKEYKIYVSSVTANNPIYLRLNNDSTADKYGTEELANNAGTIAAGRYTENGFQLGAGSKPQQKSEISLLTPSGFIKTVFNSVISYTTGTTVGIQTYGRSFNSTGNIISLNFAPSTGNFTAGTRITVYARRSQS